MKFIANYIKLQVNSDSLPEIVLGIRNSRREAIQAVSELKEITEKGKALSVEIKQYRQKRSLDANAYMWVLLSKMAAALNTTKDKLYLEVLDRYGVFTHVVVKPSAVNRVKAEWRIVRDLGAVNVNGNQGVQLQCYFGSSTYSTKEMAVLLDGIVSECKDMDIETLPPEELKKLKEAWGDD